MEFDEIRNKKVLITGISGFIGSSIAKAFLNNGAEVAGTLRPSSQLKKLKKQKSEITFHTLSLENQTEVEELLLRTGPDYIIHAAHPSAYALSKSSDLVEQLTSTSKILCNLLEASKHTPPKKFIHCCGSAIYGRKNTSPFTESEEPTPDSFRGVVKLQERNLLKFYTYNSDFSIVLARIFRAYGPWDSSKKLIVKILEAAKNGNPIPLSSKPFMRDYTFVDDIAEGILRMCMIDLPNGAELNLGSGHQHSAKEILALLESILEKKIKTTATPFPTSFLDKEDYRADLSETVKFLNWSPNTSILQGLQKTVNWFKDRNHE